MYLILKDMAPFYEVVCKDLSWKADQTLLKKMKEANETELKRLNSQIEDAQQNQGETEVRDALLAKAEYLCRIGDKVCNSFINSLGSPDQSDFSIASSKLT